MSDTPAVRGTTGVLCVIGDPIAHSLSPPMHNAAIRALGLDMIYVAFHVSPQGIEGALQGMRALGIRGMNVTVPHKAAVIPYLDEVSEEARRVGAVNTIVPVGGRLVGHNTDVYGIMTSLRETAGLSELPATVAVLGASGAARGVVYGLSTSPEVRTIFVLNRTAARAEALASEMCQASGKRVEALPLTREAALAAMAEADLLINATSVGLHPRGDESPLQDWPVLRPGLTVYDTVYNPPKTRLLHQAEAAGARAFNGLEMLVYQGARSFELWTGIYPPVEVMKQSLGLEGQ